MFYHDSRLAAPLVRNGTGGWQTMCLREDGTSVLNMPNILGMKTSFCIFQRRNHGLLEN